METYMLLLEFCSFSSSCLSLVLVLPHSISLGNIWEKVEKTKFCLAFAKQRLDLEKWGKNSTKKYSKNSCFNEMLHPKRNWRKVWESIQANWINSFQVFLVNPGKSHGLEPLFSNRGRFHGSREIQFVPILNQERELEFLFAWINKWKRKLCQVTFSGLNKATILLLDP